MWHCLRCGAENSAAHCARQNKEQGSDIGPGRDSSYRGRNRYRAGRHGRSRRWPRALRKARSRTRRARELEGVALEGKVSRTVVEEEKRPAAANDKQILHAFVFEIGE